MKAYVMQDLNDPSKKKVEYRTSGADSICEAPKLGDGYMADIAAMDFLTDDDGIVTASINMEAFTQVQIYKDQIKEDNKWDVMRSERNKRLSDCDWTQLQDSPINNTDWADYRQELRDLPDNISDIDNIVWPEKP